MTNYPEKMDKAILRDGRLGLHIEITNPDETDLEEIIETFFDKSELENLDKTQMVKALNGQTIASVYSNGSSVQAYLVNRTTSAQNTKTAWISYHFYGTWKTYSAPTTTCQWRRVS